MKGDAEKQKIVMYLMLHNSVMNPSEIERNNSRLNYQFDEWCRSGALVLNSDKRYILNPQTNGVFEYLKPSFDDARSEMLRLSNGVQDLSEKRNHKLRETIRKFVPNEKKMNKLIDDIF